MAKHKFYTYQIPLFSFLVFFKFMFNAVNPRTQHPQYNRGLLLGNGITLWFFGFTSIILRFNPSQKICSSFSANDPKYGGNTINIWNHQPEIITRIWQFQISKQRHKNENIFDNSALYLLQDDDIINSHSNPSGSTRAYTLHKYQ